jgi:hypothetical protein
MKKKIVKMKMHLNLYDFFKTPYLTQRPTNLRDTKDLYDFIRFLENSVSGSRPDSGPTNPRDIESFE